mgnify:CR=1 FL=1
MPAVIANKTREELQVYVLDLLKKLKIRDKKIEGNWLPVLRGAAPAGAPPLLTWILPVSRRRTLTRPICWVYLQNLAQLRKRMGGLW